MKKNMNATDGIIRIVLALLLLTLYFTHILNGTAGVISLFVAGVITATAFINFCPIYYLLGLSTRSKHDQSRGKN